MNFSKFVVSASYTLGLLKSLFILCGLMPVASQDNLYAIGLNERNYKSLRIWLNNIHI